MANTVNITVGADTAKAEGKLGGLGGKIGGLAKPVAIASAAVTGMAIAAVKLGDEFKEAENTIRAGTGATGEDLKALTKSFQEVFKDVPNDSKAVSTAIADLNTELGLQGKELENASKAFLDLSRVTGSDVAPMIKKVSDAMVQFGIPANEVESQLDKLLVASQAVGVPMEALAGTVGKFAPQLKAMGFSMDESTALIASMEAAGLETTRMFPGLNTAMKKMTSAGVTDLSAGLKDLMESIKNTESDTDALALAQDAFGASAGIRFADAIRSGAMETDDLIKAMNNAEGAVDELGASTLTASNKMDIMKNRIKSALAPLASMISGIGPLIMIIPGLVTAISGLSAAFVGLNIAMGPILLVIGAIAIAIIAGIIIWRKWDTISLIVTRAIDAIRVRFGFLETALDTLKTIMKTTWEGIKTAFETSVKAIKKAFTENLAWLMEDGGLRKGIDRIKEVWDNFWNGAGETMGTAVEEIKKFYDNNLAWILESGVLQKGIEKIKEIWGILWKGAEQVFRTMVIAIKQAYTSDLGWILPGGALIKAILYLEENWDEVMANLKIYTEVAFSALKTAYKNDLGWILPGGVLIKALTGLEINWKEVWDEILKYSQITWGLLKLGINSLTIDIANVFNEMVPTLNFFIKHLNKLIELLGKLKIPGFKIAEWKDGGGTYSVEMPEIESGIGKRQVKDEGNLRTTSWQDFKYFSPMKTVDLPFPDSGYDAFGNRNNNENNFAGGMVQPTSFGAGITVNVIMPANGTVILDDESSAQKFGDFISKEIRQVLRTQGAFK